MERFIQYYDNKQKKEGAILFWGVQTISIYEGKYPIEETRIFVKEHCKGVQQVLELNPEGLKFIKSEGKKDLAFYEVFDEENQVTVNHRCMIHFFANHKWVYNNEPRCGSFAYVEDIETNECVKLKITQLKFI